METNNCDFCEIVARTRPVTIFYEDDEIMVIKNRLQWAPVMLLVIPKRHMTQDELWGHSLMARVGHLAVEMGGKYCPGGFRLLSNFGTDAMQSQEHGHVHVLGGMFLGRYA